MQVVEPRLEQAADVYRDVGVDSSFRWNDYETIDTNWQPYSLNPCLPVIPAKAGIQCFM